MCQRTPLTEMCQRTPESKKQFIRPTADGDHFQKNQLTWRSHYQLIQGVDLNCNAIARK